MADVLINADTMRSPDGHSDADIDRAIVTEDGIEVVTSYPYDLEP